MKENLLPFFPNNRAEELRSYFREPFPKYEDKKPEQWVEMIDYLLEEELQPHIIQKKREAKFVDQGCIASKQFSGLG